MKMEFRVQKINYDGSIKIKYAGTLREKNDQFISIDIGWSREELDLGYVVFEPDDSWIETFYLHDNFNIFRIADKSGILKGFYCNIAYTPIIEDDMIKWKDLAIDIWIRPDGSYLILDEDEFEELDPTQKEREIAKEAINKILKMLNGRSDPFCDIDTDGV